MKTTKIFTTVILTLWFIIHDYETNPNKVTGNSKFPNLYCPPPLLFSETITKTDSKTNDTDINQNWNQVVIENIQKEEYNITYSEELGEYQSPNRTNNIRFIYHKNGFTAKTRTNKIPLFDENSKAIDKKDRSYKSIDEWSIEFRIKNEELRIKNGELNVTGNKAYIENENVRIDYTNNKDGMRQDFIIKQKPQGEGSLRLNIGVETKLKMIVGTDALMFKDKDGEDKMKYSALKAWDANGKELRAYFESNYELEIRNCKPSNKNLMNGKILNSKFLIPNSFAIVVNDKDAVYPITIDPFSSSPNWTAESDQANAFFGSSVSTAGDVNDDGYSDVIIGAERYDNGQTDEGRAYVYYGSATGLSASANWIAESNQAGASFGCSVSTAGDVNGDGYSDVIIGADLYSNGQISEGKAYVYFGSATGLSASANWTGESNQVSARFGYSVSTTGDVNGDGYSDVIVGADTYENGETNEGRTFVYYGSATGLSSSANWTAESNQADARFGCSVSTAGDINSDGYSDAIVGAFGYHNGQSYEGRAFVYHGSATGLSASANWTAESNQVGAYFGISVSTAGDVNGDGYSDVIVGAYLYDNGQTDEGKAFVYHGSATGLSASANWTGESDQAAASFGISVSTAGDINGDGYSAVIIGAFFYDNGETDEGRAYIYPGSASGLYTSASWTAESDQANALFGWNVSTAGDINGDGRADVIVGASLYDNGQTEEGRAFVYFGNWATEGNQANADFGISVSTAGDVNGDGFGDVIVGARLYDNGQTDEGRTYVYHGSPTGLSASASWTAESNQNYARFGSSVSTAGDVNGDGFGDVIVGAYQYNNGQVAEGGAYVYYGSQIGLSASANWTAEIDQVAAFFGVSVSTAGDVNGDGYSDVIVGAYGYSNGQTNEGGAYVYLGAATGLSATSSWTAESDQTNARFGSSVSTAGDVNGDGYSDLIVGAYNYSNGQTQEGRAYVYYGSQTGLSTSANWIAESDLGYAEFGWSVSTAGDVNGDGYSDIIVGAWQYDNLGRAYVYYGSQTGLLSSASWTKSVGGYTYFGVSVSTAGDVNGDGYSDVIVGAHGYSNGQINEGSAYVYFGSQSGLSASSNWTAESNQANAGFGFRVSTAGDLNGDGYDDVIVGAPMYDNGETDEGRVFVYQGNGMIPSTITLELRVLEEGFYNPATNSLVGDTVTLYLRQTTSPFLRVDSAKSFVNSNGISTLIYSNAPTGLYYLELRHRNSIETWSKNGGKVLTRGGYNIYDFTTSSSQAYGSNMILKGTKWCIYSGDINQDGAIDGSDLSIVDNAAFNYTSGYVAADVTGDNYVDASDISIVDNNAFNAVEKIIPSGTAKKNIQKFQLSKK